MEKKLAYSPNELCIEFPEEFPILLKFYRKLQLMKYPDYDGIKAIFKHLLDKKRSFGYEVLLGRKK